MQAAAPREGGRPGLLRAPRADRGHVGRADPGREGGTAPERRGARSLAAGGARRAGRGDAAGGPPGRPVRQRPAEQARRDGGRGPAGVPLDGGHAACRAGGGAGIRLRRGPADCGAERAGRRGGAGIPAAADGLVPRGVQHGRAGRSALRRAAGLASGRDGRPPPDGRPRGHRRGRCGGRGHRRTLAAPGPGRVRPPSAGRAPPGPLGACPGGPAGVRTQPHDPAPPPPEPRPAGPDRPSRPGRCRVGPADRAGPAGPVLPDRRECGGQLERRLSARQPGGPARVCGRWICGFLPGHGGRAPGR